MGIPLYCSLLFSRPKPIRKPKYIVINNHISANANAVPSTRGDSPSKFFTAIGVTVGSRQPLSEDFNRPQVLATRRGVGHRSYAVGDPVMG